MPRTPSVEERALVTAAYALKNFSTTLRKAVPPDDWPTTVAALKAHSEVWLGMCRIWRDTHDHDSENMRHLDDPGYVEAFCAAWRAITAEWDGEPIDEVEVLLLPVPTVGLN